MTPKTMSLSGVVLFSTHANALDFAHELALIIFGIIFPSYPFYSATAQLFSPFISLS